jgi:hypothetical protein
MKILTMRRTALLCAGLGAVGAISAVAFTGTSALFTGDAPAGNGNITAATVTLGSTNVGRSVTIDNLVPGDKDSQDYYALTYSGSSPAFVGLDVKVSSTASADNKGCAPQGSYSGSTLATLIADCKGGIGTLPLFDGDSNPNGALDLTTNVTGVDPAHHGDHAVLGYSDIAPKTTCTVPASGPITCTSEVDNVELRSDYTSTDASTYEQWTNSSPSLSFRLSVAMDANAGNAFQGSGATVTLTGHAVQWNNNVGGTNPDATGTCDSGTFGPSVDADPSGNTYCPVSW